MGKYFLHGRPFLRDTEYSILGCLSPEERCCAAPSILSQLPKKPTIHLVEVHDPDEGFPNYSDEANARIACHRENLQKQNVEFTSVVSRLLDTEDDFIAIINAFLGSVPHETLVLDVTSFPKRFFCFFLKRFLLTQSVRNLIITYSEAGFRGYSAEHLSGDPNPCEHLPGFAAPFPPEGNTLILSVGFEVLNIRSLLDVYRDKKKSTKIIVPFPPDGVSTRRIWNVLRQLYIIRDTNYAQNMEVIATWDCERVFRRLEIWNKSSKGLTLAPFGPKPHSVAMALFATRNDAGLYYTQPKSYHPEYTRGIGRTWAYLVKWEGIPCYERLSCPP